MYRKYVSTIFVSLLLVGFFAAIQPAAASPMNWAGCRASSYGISPFPSPKGWVNAITTMAEKWPCSIPSAVWVVGEILSENEKNNTYCGLQFPNPTPGVTYPNVIFEDVGIDHEAYLSYCDSHKVKVWLQVEPADADMNTLIDLVFKAFGKHSCVVGFGVDCEWYEYSRYHTENNAGKPVSDAEAQAWEAKVKSYNPAYTLFLKHWLPDHMPPTYRGSIIFNDDSQMFTDLASMVAEFQVWAATFYPNPVHFQVGYRVDKVWWGTYADPPKAIGDALKDALPSDQPLGVIWVDFTLRDVLPSEPVFMHVGSIDMASTKKGWAFIAHATVTVFNDLNSGARRVIVYGKWSGAWTEEVSGTTDSSGKVTFSTDTVKGGGTFTFTVTNLVMTGWTYDSSKNVETSDSITLLP